MKNIFILLLLVNNYYNNCGQVNPKFSITIWDTNSSLGYTIVYHINDDSLKVNRNSGFEDDKNRILLQRKLTENESKTFSKFLSSFPIDSLKSKYNADNTKITVMDGDQKSVQLQFNNKIKTIDIYNYYQKDLDGLFQVINKYIPDKGLKIEFDVAH